MINRNALLRREGVRYHTGSAKKISQFLCHVGEMKGNVWCGEQTKEQERFFQIFCCLFPEK